MDNFTLPYLTDTQIKKTQHLKYWPKNKQSLGNLVIFVDMERMNRVHGIVTFFTFEIISLFSSVCFAFIHIYS
jgi:hypothetical protein